MKKTDETKELLQQIKRECFPDMSDCEIEELRERRTYDIACGRAQYEYYDEFGYDE